ncbi:MAG TPA: potassium-transporting ATPase subunit KdpC [Steroidobacteraceae bacterium]|jgi:K+-transporting ATPase ATPase C chain
MAKLLLNSLLSLLLLSLLTGLVYPLLVTALAAACCTRQAQGSLLFDHDRLLGSALLGQPFDDPKYFWSRPSATAPQPYNGLASGGSNLGPTNSAQADAVKAHLQALQSADPGNDAPVPLDLVTASASGLDPDISPAAADYQVARVARLRALDPARLRALVASHTLGRQWGIFGEPRVNVLELNLALDRTH